MRASALWLGRDRRRPTANAPCRCGHHQPSGRDLRSKSISSNDCCIGCGFAQHSHSTLTPAPPVPRCAHIDPSTFRPPLPTCRRGGGVPENDTPPAASPPRPGRAGRRVTATHCMQPGAPHTKHASTPASVATPLTSSLSGPNPDKEPAVAAEDFRENRLSIEVAIFRFYSNVSPEKNLDRQNSNGRDRQNSV